MHKASTLNSWMFDKLTCFGIEFGALLFGPSPSTLLAIELEIWKILLFKTTRISKLTFSWPFSIPLPLQRRFLHLQKRIYSAYLKKWFFSSSSIPPFWFLSICLFLLYLTNKRIPLVFSFFFFFPFFSNQEFPIQVAKSRFGFIN